MNVLLSKEICRQTIEEVLAEQSALAIQCAWRARASRRAKAVQDRVRYSNLFDRLRAKSALQRAATSTRHDVNESGWALLVSKLASAALRSGEQRPAAPASPDSHTFQRPAALESPDAPRIAAETEEGFESAEALLITRVVRGFLARKRVLTQWQWQCTKSHRVRHETVTLLQRAWRCALARRQLVQHAFIRAASCPSQTSMLHVSPPRIILHNAEVYALRCVRQSDKHTIQLQQNTNASLDYPAFFRPEGSSILEVWRVYKAGNSALVKVILLPRSCQVAEDVHVYTDSVRNRLCVIAGWKLPFSQKLSLATLERLSKRDFEEARPVQIFHPNVGVELTSPSNRLSTPPVWEVGSTQVIKWRSWANDLGIPAVVGLVSLVLIKKTSSNDDRSHLKMPKDSHFAESLASR